MRDEQQIKDDKVMALAIVAVVISPIWFALMLILTLILGAPRQEMTIKNVKMSLAKYTIQCDLVYTGSPTTYVKYQGEKVFSATDGRTSNGLPVEGIFPEHALLPFTRNNGEKCNLYVPISGSPVTAMVACENRPNRFYLTAEIFSDVDGVVHIEARDGGQNASATLGSKVTKL